jgi:hypothetical protein
MSGNKAPNIRTMELFLEKTGFNTAYNQLMDYFFNSPDPAVQRKLKEIEMCMQPAQIEKNAANPGYLDSLKQQFDSLLEMAPQKLSQAFEGSLDLLIHSPIENFSPIKAFLQGGISVLFEPTISSIVLAATYARTGVFDARPAAIAALMWRMLSELVKRSDDPKVVGAFAFFLLGTLFSAVNKPAASNVETPDQPKSRKLKLD